MSQPRVTVQYVHVIVCAISVWCAASTGAVPVAVTEFGMSSRLVAYIKQSFMFFFGGGRADLALDLTPKARFAIAVSVVVGVGVVWLSLVRVLR